MAQEGDDDTRGWTGVMTVGPESLSNQSYNDKDDDYSNDIDLKKMEVKDKNQEEEEEEDSFEFEEDVYTLLFISANKSKEFILAAAIISTQLLVLIMIYIDITGDDDRPAGVEDENRFNIPVTVELQVSMAQVLAFVIVVLTQENALVSIDALCFAMYDPAILDQFKHATAVRWAVVNHIRWFVGLFTFAISFLIVGQSDNVLDIFMNFAALDFLDGLDNSAFSLAKGGYFGVTMEEHAKAIGTLSFKRNRSPVRTRLAQMAFAANLIFLLLGWVLLRVQQRTGQFLEAAACNSVIVTFGDDVYNFEPPAHNPPLFKPMHYAYFSGQYFAEFDSDDRPVYYERGDKDPKRGRFYYCDEEKSWHFTIPALADVLPEGSTHHCKDGWLMQSPITDAYMLEDVSLEGWTVISGEGTPQVLQELTIQCGECSRAADCSFNGVCTSKGTCECDAGWQGFKCNLVAPYCEELLWLEYGESAADYVEVGPYRLIKIAKQNVRDTGALEVYNRPVYVKKNFNENGCGFVLLYTGRRWYETYACFTILNGDFHAYWDALAPSFFFSEPTLSEQPVGFSWNKVRDNLSKGTYGAFGATRSLEARYVCMHIDKCVRRETCGVHGTCFLASSGRTNCACDDYSGGFYCEFNKNSEYCREEYQAFDAFIRANGYPNETTFEELDAIIQEADSLATNYYLRYWRPVLATALNVTGIESFDPNVTLTGDGSKSGDFSEGIVDFNETDLGFNLSDSGLDLGGDGDFVSNETEAPIPEVEEEPIVNQTDTNETDSKTDDFFEDEYFDDEEEDLGINQTLSNETDGLFENSNGTIGAGTDASDLEDFYEDEYFDDDQNNLNSTGVNGTGFGVTEGDSFLEDIFFEFFNNSNGTQAGSSANEVGSTTNDTTTTVSIDDSVVEQQRSNILTKTVDEATKIVKELGGEEVEEQRSNILTRTADEATKIVKELEGEEVLRPID